MWGPVVLQPRVKGLVSDQHQHGPPQPSWLCSLFQDTIEELQIKVEPEGDVEIRSYPVLKNVSIRLTDCRLWLEGRDFLSLGESSEPTLHPSPPAGTLLVGLPNLQTCC